MTKKHYEAIAKALRSSKPTDSALEAEISLWERTAAAVTDAIRGFNPNFDQIRFEKAAGLIEEGC